MANRVEISEDVLDQVVGGTLVWEGKTVHPKNNPDVQYKFRSFTKCMQWIDANWNSAQDEACLEALAAAGLVTKI